MLTLTSPITTISGIGPVKAEAFARLGIEQVRDLLFHVPRAYEDRGSIRLLADGRDGAPSSFLLTVGTEPRVSRIRRGLSLTKFRAFDESGSVEVVFFNQDYLRTTFRVGECYRFSGKLTPSARVYQLASPKYEKFTEGEALPDLVPIYSLTEGISQGLMAKTVAVALTGALPLLEDYLPEEIRLRHGFPTLASALKQLHAPTSREAVSRALRRLAFDDFFLFSLGVSLSKRQAVSLTAPPMKSVDPAPFLRLLPYELTGAQKRVCNEITRDMISGSPMQRILVGDVGCGKTVCAAFAIYVALKNGYQAALMTPTEILARQHDRDLDPLLSALGYRVALLLGSTPAAEKRAIYERLAAGEIDLVIGTHALLSDKVRFHSLGLTVTDEQHRFGVYQRAALKEKSTASHFMVMSATPIPRTLALVLYGDLNISKIDEMPKGRQRVDTFVVDEGYRARLNAFIRKQVSEGGQVYVVCPAIEPSEKETDGALGTEVPLSSFGTAAREEATPLKTTVEVTEEMRRTFPDLRIAFLHGKMRTAQKDEIMNDFADGALDILVSTTVIEVGVNVPNACLMIVENAERFGLAQLHQLRGRVGRGKRRSYCILVSDNKGAEAHKRLQTMRTTYDGYAVAEQDLKQRGPGDFLSSASSDVVRQSGGLFFRFATLCEDTDILSLATEEAARLADADTPIPPHLLAEVERTFKQNATILS